MQSARRLRRCVETCLWDLWPPTMSRKRKTEPSSFRIGRYVRALNREERRLEKQVAADSCHLHRFESARHSQNGEDGIIAEIFGRIGRTNRSFIEIGASDGVENCTAALVEAGWRGVWIEGDPAKVGNARQVVGTRPVTIAESFVDRASILPVLAKAGAPTRPDLLVIDIDGNDYWVWETLGRRYPARVVVIEYNAVVGPRLNWVMPYDKTHHWDGTRRHGAGLAALASLGSSLDYTLVGCDSHGVNAFFVVSSEAERFSRRSVQGHYVGPRYGLPFGHPRYHFESFEANPVPEDECRLVKLRVASPERKEVRPAGLVYIHATVENGTSVSIGSSRLTPVDLAGWWVDKDNQRLGGEPCRSTQYWRAEPGRAAHLVGRVAAPSVPGRYTLVFGLVQETVRWFDNPAARTVVGDWIVG